MNDVFFLAFAALLILTLVWDSRHYPDIWHDKEDKP